MAADYWLAAIPLDADQSWRPHPWTNTVNVTVELSSFGRPKEEKLKPHLHPLREAATITWSKHSLGYSLVNWGVNEVNQQPIIANERPATSANLRRTSTVDTGTRRRNGGHPQPLFWRSRWDHSAAAVSVHPGRRQAILPPIQSSVTGGSFLSSVLASPHILGQPFFGLQPFTRGFSLGQIGLVPKKTL
ncbi:hypothetical protein Taro_007428 [Colocasia esculenta]|uniref:Uncharacterized protein n=1 Tax=Colocasia esculenta TaxID=4460 RepID=A0A843TZN0_COLES|nr:hypothetical protein [Colocasia esculenta]